MSGVFEIDDAEDAVIVEGELDFDAPDDIRFLRRTQRRQRLPSRSAAFLMARSRSTIGRTTGAHLPSIRTVRDWIRPLNAVTTFVIARGDPQTRRTHSAMSWPSSTVRMVLTVSTTARSTIRIRNASGLRDRLSSYTALRHPGPQKTRGRPLPAAGGRLRAAPDAQGRGYSPDGGLLHVTHSRKVRQATPFRHRRNGRVLDLQEAWHLDCVAGAWSGSAQRRRAGRTSVS